MNNENFLEEEIAEAASLMGKKGGKKTREKYGIKHYSEMGKKGGSSIKEKYGNEYFTNLINKRHEKNRQLKKLKENYE